MGDDAVHLEVVESITPQGGPQADMEEKSKMERQSVYIPPLE